MNKSSLASEVYEIQEKLNLPGLVRECKEIIEELSLPNIFEVKISKSIYFVGKDFAICDIFVFSFQVYIYASL